MEECAEAAGEATAESGGHYGCRYFRGKLYFGTAGSGTCDLRGARCICRI